MSEYRFSRLQRREVSIVIVTLDAIANLRRALQALVENTEPCYELILVDNGSADGTPGLLRELENVTIVLNSRNRGFGVASNQGAARARGRYLVFLNQDAFVHPGWLAPLLEHVESNDKVGAVGPMVLNPDGSLQCAGALLTRSGSAACYGDGHDPDQAEYRFARIVDYLAGACLLVRHSAFNEVGGFDPAYGFAYYEDADLCLALAARGYRSIYEPRSRITHLRGKPSPKLLRLALRNRAFFERRWRRELTSRPLAPLDASRRRTLAARDAPAVVAATFGDVPQPPEMAQLRRGLGSLST